MNAFALLQHYALPYGATLVIGMVCAYLGLFTVLRRIVFTGVALAQLAAAGVAASFFVADHPAAPEWLHAGAERFGATVGSVGAALLGALGLETRWLRKMLSSDALVGLCYSAAAALAVLLVWRSARGLAELQNILAGEVLLQQPGDLVALLAGLALVTALHVVLRERFLLVSFDPEFARALGLPERRDQALLLGSLALAVALSLRAGGLLLVFAFLVLPPVAGLALGRRLGEATWLALVTAAGASFLGFMLAILENLPVPPSVSLCMLGLTCLAGVGKLVPRLGQPVRLTLLALAGVAGVALLGAVATPSGEPAPPPPPPVVAPRADDHPDDHHAGHDHPAGETAQGLAEWVSVLRTGASAAERRDAALHLEDLADAAALEPLVAALGDEDAAVQRAASRALTCLAAQPGVRERLRALADDSSDAAPGADAELRVLAAFALLDVGELRGAERLVAELSDPDLPLLLGERVGARLAALNHGDALGWDAFGEDAAKAAATARWQAWWRDAGAKLHWDAAHQRFVATGSR